ncbi:hypothetical protein C3K47_10485 [Solitalea longa]|uniref:Outer membrane protein beta-barrel domain-containing protein n=1 Tax=Solitalea longa TaxID=2079460 RepID=A0A2S5A2M5_9SPHI|nr:hypothetical protein [Solitalea longa]POY36774.1 hypothetical protein C3K47_10485 [Solitalea longa]
MKRTLLLAIILFTTQLLFAQSKWSLELSGSAGGFKDNFYGIENRYYDAGLSYKIEPRIYYEALNGLNLGIGIGYLNNTSRRETIGHLDPSDPNHPSIEKTD